MEENKVTEKSMEEAKTTQLEKEADTKGACNENTENETEDYVTFHITASDGSDVEMAVVDEFDFENKHYVVSARIEGDTICEDGQYIYRAKVTEDDFTVEKITNSIDYKRVIRAYMEMDNQ